jgi:hypothetical protein
MLFDGPPAELPTATLVPSGVPEPRQLLGALDRWLALRWAWLAPRAIPLAVAAIGLCCTLGVVKYGGLWARSNRLSLGVHSRTQDTPPHAQCPDGRGPSPAGSAAEWRCGSIDRHGRLQPTQIVIRPLDLRRDHYVVLTIDPPDAP